VWRATSWGTGWAGDWAGSQHGGGDPTAIFASPWSERHENGWGRIYPRGTFADPLSSSNALGIAHSNNRWQFLVFCAANATTCGAND
jgi:hypothetical protein